MWTTKSTISECKKNQKLKIYNYQFNILLKMKVLSDDLKLLIESVSLNLIKLGVPEFRGGNRKRSASIDLSTGFRNS